MVEDIECFKPQLKRLRLRQSSTLYITSACSKAGKENNYAIRKSGENESQSGPDVWLFRWSEQNFDGKRVCRKRVIGTVDEYSACEAARRSAANLIAKVNSANRCTASNSMTVAELCNHFEQRELGSTNTWRSYATKKCYAVYLRRWIVPHWGNYELCNVKTIEVESWLRRLHLAKSSCAKIRNLMSVLFQSCVPISAL